MGGKSGLLIASSEYEDASIRTLKGPLVDVESLQKVLERPEIGGFEIRSSVNEKEYVVRPLIQRSWQRVKRRIWFCYTFQGTE